MKKCIILLVIVSIVISIFNPLTIYYSSAAASNDAMKVLSGEWHTASMPGKRVKFTKKWCKYYTNKGKLISKAKIVSTKKKPYGYLIKLKYGKSKTSYRTSMDDWKILEYYESWSTKDYSGSSSLWKE